MFNYTPPQKLLANRTILITGAGQGIGKAVAMECAKLGATVILLGRTIQKLEHVAQQITQLGYPTPIVIPFNLDTTSDYDYQQLVQLIKNHTQCLDGLLHNAAIALPLTSLENTLTEDFQKVMHVNVTACFSLTKALLPLLKNANDASIIFTSSSVGRKGRALWGAYAISKFAIEGMMQTLADELQNTSVRVNSVNPGATRTDMRMSIYPEETPTNNPTPEEIVPVYLYLLGSDSKEINGQALDAQ